MPMPPSRNGFAGSAGAGGSFIRKGFCTSVGTSSNKKGFAILRVFFVDF